MYSQMEQTGVSATSIDSVPSPLRRNNRRIRHVYSTYTPNHRFSRYHNTLLGLLPIRLIEKTSELAVQRAGLFSFITSHWIIQYLFQNYNSKNVTQIPKCPKQDSCRINSARLDGLFNSQVTKQGLHNLSVFTVVWNFVQTRTIFACLFYTFASLLSMLGLVLFLPHILYKNNENIFTAMQYMCALILTELISGFLYSTSNAINLRTAIRLRSACFASLYRQAMLTSLTYRISSWQLVSFLLSEGQHVQDMVMAIPNLICTPIILICCMLLAGLNLQLWGYLSVVIIFTFFPIFIIVAIISKNLLHKANFFSDQRVKFLEDFIVNNIYVKFLKKEQWFKNNISEKREKEVANIKKAGFYDNLCVSFILIQPFLSFTALFISYSMTLELSTFAAICIILLIHMKQSLDNFWHGLNNFIKGLAAFQKFKKVMNYNTIRLKDKRPNDKNIAIFIEDACFQWTKDIDFNIKQSNATSINGDLYLVSPTKKIPVDDILHNINLTVENGKLIGICGLPGSGRSSLLLAVMGLLLKSKGNRVTIGHFAYISQEPIIFHDTVKNNIIFGSELDAHRYYLVIQNCELQEFFMQLPQQDETIIESKLLTLEQKQKIILARALYENGDIYLLDEPLNALEYHKSIGIFENTIKNFLQDKTILLVTDQTKFLEQCDEVYMIERGTIVYQGHHDDLKKNVIGYSDFVEYLSKQSTCKEKSNLFEICTDIPNSSQEFYNNPNSLNFNLLMSSDSLNTFDDADTGVKKLIDGQENDNALKKVVRSYFSHFGNCFSMTLLFLAQVVNATLISCLPVFFIYSLATGDRTTYLTIYFGLFFWMLLFGIVMNYYFNQKMFSASILFHNDIMRRLYRASLSFFQQKSFSVISTISIQLQLTDDDIPRLIQNTFLNFFVAVMTACVIIFASPWYIVIVFAVTIIMILVTVFVRKSLLTFNKHGIHYTDILYTQVLKMLTARSIIQAYNKVEFFANVFYDTYDEYMVHLYIMNAAKNWHSFVLYCCSVLLIAFLGIMLILLEPACTIVDVPAFSIDKGTQTLTCRALTIVCILQICYVLQKLFTFFLNTSLTFDVLAEVHKFKMSIPNEYPDEEYDDEEELNEEYKLEETAQSIKLQNVSLHLEFPVLSSLSLVIQENEKMGFIGLKSDERKAIIAILYKLSSITSGSVHIGKKRISQIPLRQLRLMISVIPSEPIMFKSTIKKILMPTNSFQEPLIEILKKFHLFDGVNLLPNKLDSDADHYLTNEEKQILCLAQAYVKQTPIIIIEDFINGSKLEYILGTHIRSLFPISTMLVFANDVAGLKSCDSITVFKDGKVHISDNARRVVSIISEIPETSF